MVFLSFYTWLVTVNHFGTLVLTHCNCVRNIWGSALKNSTTVLHSDNLVVGQIINKNTSNDPKFMQIMRRLMILFLAQSIHFYAKHIQGVKYIFADLLSQLQVSILKTRFSHLDKEQTTVPLITSQLAQQIHYFSLQVRVPIV